MSIVLTLPVPPSANRMWATRVVAPKGKRPMALTYLTAEAKQYKETVLTVATQAGVRTPIEGRVKIEVWFYPNRPLDWKARQRKLGAHWDNGVMACDIDNLNKSLLDSLKDVCFGDDKMVFQLASQRMEPDEHGPRVVVRINKIDPPAPQGELLEQAS